MTWLIIHQNFPGQYKLLVKHLAALGKKVVGVGRIPYPTQSDGLSYVQIRRPAHLPRQSYPPLLHFQEQVRWGSALADELLVLRQQGLSPEVILVHPGWGDALFLRELFPGTPIIAYLEFFYRAINSDVDFDPEFPMSDVDRRYVELRNASSLFALGDAAATITPTNWQRSLFPTRLHHTIDVIHDGIDTNFVRRQQDAHLALPGGGTLSAEDEVLTYVARSLEPYRGFHKFMRALPAILAARPNLRVVIVGRDGVSYGSEAPGGGSWREHMLRELSGSLPENRVFFLGSVSYEMFRKVLSVSTVHVYLTYPFVLSWSLLEAMSAECCVAASATGPVTEVITDGHNGRLVDFFNQEQFINLVLELLGDRSQRERLRRAARQTIVSTYDFDTRALPDLRRLIEVRLGLSGLL